METDLSQVDKEDVVGALTRVDKSINEMKISFDTGLRQIALIPVSVVFAGIFTWLFYFKMINEYLWAPFMLILMFPYFGEGIKAIVAQGYFKNSGNKTAIVLFFALATTLVTGCVLNPS